MRSTAPVAELAFTSATDGDMRGDSEARTRVASRLGIVGDWATCRQVHGGRAVLVDGPGDAGEADAMVTVREALPVAVFTADCLGVVVKGRGAVGVAHAGWRGLVAGVIEATVAMISETAAEPVSAHIGPSIGPCCFEVGEDVAALFPHDLSTTTWGTTSVDLRSAARRRLRIATTVDDRCTACGGGHSHRHEGTARRLAAVGWLG